MSNFQIAIVSAFIFFALVAVVIFSGLVPGLKKGGGSAVGGQVVMWGTIPVASMFKPVEDFNNQNKPIVLAYAEKNPATLDRDLVEALAAGNGPDMVMLPRDLIYRHADKLYPIPYGVFSQREYVDTFIQEGELYLTAVGVLALPFRLDPMVMYWNRDILSNAGFSQPASSWEEILADAPKFIKKDSSGNIKQSVVSFGEYDNINNAKDILAILSMQAGDPITARGNTGWQAVFGGGQTIAGSSLKPADEAVRYFTAFSDPAKPVYSWNKSLPNSRDAFLAGRLAYYFGYASELLSLRNLNPHLNFDVAKMPQAKGAKTQMTIANMDGLAVLKASRNPGAAFQAAGIMTQADFQNKLSGILLLPPPRRDILANKPPDAYMRAFYDSAIISRGWMDPSPSLTDAIFRELVENVVSGRSQVSDAVMNANAEMIKLFGGN